MPDDDAIAQLTAADPVMAKLIERLGTDWLEDARLMRQRSGAYEILVRAIVGQQFSTRAAAAMYARLEARFGGRLPTPDEILADDPDRLRTAVGLSHAKVAYLRSLAEHLLDGRLVLDALPGMSDDEVIAQLTAVNGLGLWSAQLFLIFHLQRADVLAAGDLGIRRAVMNEYALAEMPTPATVDGIARPWTPNRTLAGLLLWRSIAASPGD